MKKLIIAVAAALSIASCTKDINMSGLRVKYYNNNLSGQFLAYDAFNNTQDTLLFQFTPNWLDSATNTALNHLLMFDGIGETHFTYELREEIENGVSRFYITHSNLAYNRQDSIWEQYSPVTMEVISHEVDANGMVTAMEVQRDGSENLWVFEKL